MKTPSVKVITNEANPETVEVIAASILAIAEGMKAVRKTRLTRKAIICLIHDTSRIGKRDIEIVLNSLERLEVDWLKPISK